MQMKHKYIVSLILGGALFAGCTATIPNQYAEEESYPVIHPAYEDGITIPYNIAPLNVAYEMEDRKSVV